MRNMIRVIIDSVIEGAIKRLAAARGISGETFLNREYFQHYGFTSRPLPGAEGIVVREGNHWVLIASDDRRYRITLEEGEVALYDDQGQVVYLKRNKTTHVYGVDHLVADVAVDTVLTCPDVTVNADHVTANVSADAVVNCPDVTVNAETQITLNSPLVVFTGSLQVSGSIGAAGGISSTDGEVSDSVRTMSGDRAIYNGHDHNDPQGGITSTPNQQQ